MASRNLDDLHPSLIPLAKEFLRQAQAQLPSEISVLITCTYRSNEEQTALYAQGRTKPGRIVTNAAAGQSKHNFTLHKRPASKAFDIVPLRNGKCVWGTQGNGIDDNPADDVTDDLEIWQRLGIIGEMLGLEWAGKWKRFKEYPHFQLKE
jgi:peptidoglycan L-alanyl-D-glutamate endopeptidase CwlK